MAPSKLYKQVSFMCRRDYKYLLGGGKIMLERNLIVVVVKFESRVDAMDRYRYHKLYDS